ncbi:MAG: hypothetical protein MRY83_21820 [Flavobacteriales bacterium]|nr:hypothetical protein [Flavobacteriales bacterium]
MLACNAGHEYIKGYVRITKIVSDKESGSRSGEELKALIHQEDYHKSHHHFVKYKDPETGKSGKIPVLEISELHVGEQVYNTVYYRLKDGSVHHTFAKKIKGDNLQLYMGIADVSPDGTKDHFMTYFLVKKHRHHHDGEDLNHEEIAVFALPKHYSEEYKKQVMPFFSDNKKALDILAKVQAKSGLEFAEALLQVYNSQN